MLSHRQRRLIEFMLRKILLHVVHRERHRVAIGTLKQIG